MTSITFASRPLPIAIGHALDTFGFQLVIDQRGQRHLYWPDNSERPSRVERLPGASPDVTLLGECEYNGAKKALVHLVRHMSQDDFEILFEAFAECERTASFDFRELLSA